LWAAILCFTTWPLFTRLKAKLGGRPTMAASLATLALSAIIIAPVAILVSRLSGNVAEIIDATRKFIHEGPPHRRPGLPRSRS
jgi:predicted PurR-regulated permease PerM